MLQYAARRAKIPQKEIDAIFERYPDREWDEYDCNYMVSMWWGALDPMAKMISHCQNHNPSHSKKKTEAISQKGIEEINNEMEKESK